MAKTTETRVLVGFSDLLDWRQLEFLRPVHSCLVCALCGLVSKSPLDPGCGHFYCLRCYNSVLNDEPRECPLDNTPVFRERRPLDVPWAVVSVTQNRIRCPNTGYGCGYVGLPAPDEKTESALEALEDHYHDCLYYHTSCQSCGTVVLSGDVFDHVRKCHADSKAEKSAGRGTMEIENQKQQNIPGRNTGSLLYR